MFTFTPQIIVLLSLLGVIFAGILVLFVLISKSNKTDPEYQKAKAEKKAGKDKTNTAEKDKNAFFQSSLQENIVVGADKVHKTGSSVSLAKNESTDSNKPSTIKKAPKQNPFFDEEDQNFTL